MRLSVLEAGLDEERDQLVSFFRENLTDDSTHARFNWLYLHSPAGPARAWIARDSGGQIAGAAAAFPRDFWIGSKRGRFWVLGDFCVARSCRSLGPALQLQRACLDFVRDKNWYDFPSRRMMAVYKRLGVEAVGSSVRFAKLLRIDSKVEQLVPALPLARTISRAGNMLIRAGSFAPRSNGLQVDVFDGSFGEEFDELDRTLGPQGTQGQRTAAFLNWRYRQCPIAEYIVLTARDSGRLVGYVAGTIQGIEATLADIRTLRPEAVPPMLFAMEELLRDKGIHIWNTPAFAGDALLNRLRSAGFYARETSPVVFGGCDQQPWLLASDRDS